MDLKLCPKCKRPYLADKEICPNCPEYTWDQENWMNVGCMVAMVVPLILLMIFWLLFFWAFLFR